MKNKSFVFCLLFLVTFIFESHSQTESNKGVVQLIEFSNATAKFTVPTGKHWEVVNIFSDLVTDFKPNTDGGNATYDEVNIYLKSINGTILTDFSIGKIGTRLYSTSKAGSLQMPIIFPENSVFELIIVSGTLSIPKINNTLIAFMNFVEYDN